MHLTAFGVGAAAWMFTGAVHDVLESVLPGDPELNAAMRASHIQVGPISLQAQGRFVTVTIASILIRVSPEAASGVRAN